MYPWLLAQVSTPSTTAAPAAPVLPAVPVAPASQAADAVASTAAAGTASAPATGPKPAVQETPWLLYLLPLLFVGYFFMTRGPKKEEKKRKAMLDGMKRGDEVETIGGLFGKIVDIKDDRIIIKIDESTNVRAAYRKGAILRVVTQDDKDKEAMDDKK